MWRACRLFLIFLVGLAGFGFPHPAAAAIDIQLVAGGIDFLVGMNMPAIKATDFSWSSSRARF